MTGEKSVVGYQWGESTKKRERFPTVTRNINKGPEWSFPMKYRELGEKLEARGI